MYILYTSFLSVRLVKSNVGHRQQARRTVLLSVSRGAGTKQFVGLAATLTSCTSIATIPLGHNPVIRQYHCYRQSTGA